ncbi:MAG TPA: GNAT family N-acetyltransferase [Candidatus Krumholzibacteria bacterium]|nr:GNAT family N-acetyltransferase [Candidatus Krumholzibacteria bacterium]
MDIDRLDAWIPELDALADRSANATFYHTGIWLGAMAEAYPRMTLRVLVARRNGTAVAYLPYFETRRGFLRALWSLPFGTYGGPVGDAVECAGLMQEFRAQLAAPGVIEVGCVDHANALAADGWDVFPSSTHVVDISGGFDRVWHDRFDKPRRRRVRRAEELGVTVRRGAGREDVARFMEVYRERLRDWKSGQGHPESLFFALVERGGDRVRLYVAEHQGVVVGGHLNFYYKEDVIAWYGMTSTRAGDTQAGTLLYSVCMRDACDAGYRAYNLGASLGKRSLIEYKESLGGVMYTYRTLRRRRLGGRVAAFLRRAARPS